MKWYQSIIACIIGIAILAAYGFTVIEGETGWKDLKAMREELKTLKTQNEILAKKNLELQEKVNRMKNDMAFIEDMVRQELKVIGKDEIVFKFKNQGPETHE